MPPRARSRPKRHARRSFRRKGVARPRRFSRSLKRKSFGKRSIGHSSKRGRTRRVSSYSKAPSRSFSTKVLRSFAPVNTLKLSYAWYERIQAAAAGLATNIVPCRYTFCTQTAFNNYPRQQTFLGSPSDLVLMASILYTNNPLSSIKIAWTGYHHTDVFNPSNTTTEFTRYRLRARKDIPNNDGSGNLITNCFGLYCRGLYYAGFANSATNDLLSTNPPGNTDNITLYDSGVFCDYFKIVSQKRYTLAPNKRKRWNMRMKKPRMLRPEFLVSATTNTTYTSAISGGNILWWMLRGTYFDLYKIHGIPSSTGAGVMSVNPGALNFNVEQGYSFWGLITAPPVKNVFGVPIGYINTASSLLPASQYSAIAGASNQ